MENGGESITGSNLNDKDLTVVEPNKQNEPNGQTSSETIIELKDVSFEVQGQKIVNNISCKFEKGKTYALIGTSGSGKSSVLKIAAALILPTSGKVLYKGGLGDLCGGISDSGNSDIRQHKDKGVLSSIGDFRGIVSHHHKDNDEKGIDIFKMHKKETKEFRLHSAFVFQDSALWANQSIRQILELPIKFHFPKMSAKQRTQKIKEAVELVGYKRSLDIRPAALSMGEQKLIAFARAIINQPDLIYLDEWTESLDDFSANRLLNIVQGFKQQKKTIIYVSHDLEIIQKLADYIYIIEKGSLYKIIKKEDMETDKELISLIKKELGNEI